MKKITMPAKKKSNPQNVLVNWALIDDMLLALCELHEIAAATGISLEILDEQSKIKFNKSFYEYRDAKRAETILNLRQSQIELSKTNATVLIWLGKVYLGQRDKAVSQNPASNPADPEITIELHGSKSKLLNPAALNQKTNDEE